MIEEGVRRPGRMEWPTAAPAGEANGGRMALLLALEAYRRGVAEAPVVCKWGTGTGMGVVAAAGLPRFARNDEGFVVRQAHHERVKDYHDPAKDYHDPAKDHHERVKDHHEREGGGPLVFVASTGEVDRHGDTVAPEGWRLAGYRENPVVLWAHDYRQPAIGRADAVWSDGRALLARLEFAPTEFAGQVERLYRQGYQRGVSVGFRPLRFEERRDPVNGAFLGIRFLEQELLEISAVPVPANGDALLTEIPLTPVSSTGQAPTLSQMERGPVADEVVGLLRGLRG